MDEVQHQVIRRTHQAGQVLPQVHQHQETMAVVAAKVAVPADQDVE